MSRKSSLLIFRAMAQLFEMTVKTLDLCDGYSDLKSPLSQQYRWQQLNGCLYFEQRSNGVGQYSLQYQFLQSFYFFCHFLFGRILAPWRNSVFLCNLISTLKRSWYYKRYCLQREKTEFFRLKTRRIRYLDYLRFVSSISSSKKARRFFSFAFVSMSGAIILRLARLPRISQAKSQISLPCVIILSSVLGIFRRKSTSRLQRSVSL